MKPSKSTTLLLTIALALSASHLSATPMGTAFSYQGMLDVGTNAANGSFDLKFTLYDALDGGSVVGTPQTNTAVNIANGLYTVTLDFGSSAFHGNGRWLEMGVRTNGSGTDFTILSPRTEVSPTPYAQYSANTAASNLVGTLPSGVLAGTYSNAVNLNNAGNSFTGNGGGLTNLNAANLSGTVANGQLANSSVTVNAGTGLSGGGTVPLGGSTTLTNTGVLSVTGNADLTATPTNGNVVLGTTASSVNTASTIVKRDASGNFSAGSVTLDGVLDLPATTDSAGIIRSGGKRLLHAYGTGNTFVGLNAGNVTMSGSFNTANGYGALYANRSGNNNTANGANALLLNTSGNNNTANGSQALASNTNGNNNTANGMMALYYNTSGSGNTANGSQALYSNTNGNNNTASGTSALFNNTSGNNNTANGGDALYSNTNGSFNTASGNSALYANRSGNNNTANGAAALYNNTSGSNNTANGAWALYYNANGFDNTANGAAALYNNTSGSDNTANGRAALYLNTSGSGNTVNGRAALFSNTSGNNNTANGYGALCYNTNGSYNAAIGYDALFYNTSGSNNIALGYLAGYNLTTGSYNIAIGNPGVAGESQVIRLGTTNVQTNAFIAGIYGVTASNGTAVFVNSAGQLGTVGTIGMAQLPAGVLTNNQTGVTVSGTFSGDGAGLTNLPQQQLPAGALTNGQTGVTLSGTFSGSGAGLTNLAALTIQQNTNGAPNIIAGSPWNYVANGVVGATISGGGATNYAGMGYRYTNSVTADFGTVGGGERNTSGDAATVGGGRVNTASGGGATVGGGLGNTASGWYATVGGGYNNTASGWRATVGGGGWNTASGIGAFVGGGFDLGPDYPCNVASGDMSVVSGGCYNTASGVAATVGGGSKNQATNNHATVPGGVLNRAGGQYSFAAGCRAKAYHTGAFVWADSQDADFASTASDQVSFRCTNGVVFTSGSGAGNQTVSWTPGSGSWTFSSDRNLKEGFVPVDSRQVLEKVSRLPIAQWQYKGYAQQHIGPVAQDFHALFPLNENETTLNSADLDGVALAAIQGLNQKLEAKNAALEKQVAELKALVTTLLQKSSGGGQ